MRGAADWFPPAIKIACCGWRLGMLWIFSRCGRLLDGKNFGLDGSGGGFGLKFREPRSIGGFRGIGGGEGRVGLDCESIGEVLEQIALHLVGVGGAFGALEHAWDGEIQFAIRSLLDQRPQDGGALGVRIGPSSPIVFAVGIAFGKAVVQNFGREELFAVLRCRGDVPDGDTGQGLQMLQDVGGSGAFGCLERGGR